MFSLRLASLVGLLLFPAMVLAQTEEAATTQEPAHPAVVTAASSKTEEGQEIWVYKVRFTGGPQKGQEVTIGDDEGATNIGFKNFATGDRVLVSTIHHISGTDRYLILDYARTSALWWLVIIFVLVIAWFSRWQGIRSLIGLAFSFVVIIGWIVPNIAKGTHPIPITLVGCAVILVAGFLLTEGWSRKTLAASIGTVSTMVAIGVLSLIAIRFVQLTGEGTEEAFFLQGMADGTFDLRGLLLAGILIGTLGILDDVAIAQVAAVAELRNANPGMSPRQLYQSAMRVGRSHLAAIVNTLVLAYAGAALPLLVLFSLNQQSTGSILNSELISTEVVRAIVGSIGLILAVPLSTMAAVWLRVQSKK